jgi:hypothetical protein
MVNLHAELTMSRNYPAGSNPASSQPSAPPSATHSASSSRPPYQAQHRPLQPPIGRPGPSHPHHHGHGAHHQPPHHHRPIQPNRPSQPGAEQPLSDTFDYKVFEDITYPYCMDLSKYETILKIGQGTFGEVHKAKDKKTNQIVALKKVLTENEKEGVGLQFNKLLPKSMHTLSFDQLSSNTLLSSQFAYKYLELAN